MDFDQGLSLGHGALEVSSLQSNALATASNLRRLVRVAGPLGSCSRMSFL